MGSGHSSTGVNPHEEYDPSKLYVSSDIYKALRSDEIQPLLRKHMKEMNCEGLLDFFAASQHVRVMQLSRTSEEVITYNIRRIWEQFLCPDAPVAIDIKSELKDVMVADLAESLRNLAIAEDEVVAQVRSSVWPRFLESPHGSHVCVVNEETVVRHRMTALLESIEGGITVPIARDSPNAMALALEDEQIQALFLEYLSMKFNDEMLEFYLIADKVLHMARHESLEVTFEKLQGVTLRFLKDEGDRVVNISPFTRADLIACMENIHIEEGDDIQEVMYLLRVAKDEAYKLIVHSHWRSFLETSVGKMIMFDAERNSRVSRACTSRSS